MSALPRKRGESLELPPRNRGGRLLAYAEAREDVGNHALADLSSVDLADGTKGKFYVRGCKIDREPALVCLYCRENIATGRAKRRMLARRGYNGISSTAYLLVGEKSVYQSL